MSHELESQPGAAPQRATRAGTRTGSTLPPTAVQIKARLAGQSPQERGREKAELALGWLALFHKSSPGIIRQVVGVASSGYSAKLVRSGLAKDITAPTIRSGKAVMLTADGLNIAEKLYPEHLGQYNVDPSSVSHSTLKHDLAVQLGMIALIDRLNVRSILPERLIPGHVQGEKRPDALFWLEDTSDDLPLAFELELTGKKPGRERDMALAAVVRALREDRYEMVIYMTDSQAIIDAYRKVLAETIPLWTKNRRSGKWELTGATIRATEDVLSRIEWICRPRLLDALNG